MWFYPSLMVLAVGLMMVSQPPPLAPIALSVIAVSTIVGSLIGWQRGRLTHITIDPETHDLTSKTSPVGMILVLALFAVKYAMSFPTPWTCQCPPRCSPTCPSCSPSV